MKKGIKSSCCLAAGVILCGCSVKHQITAARRIEKQDSVRVVLRDSIRYGGQHLVTKGYNLSWGEITLSKPDSLGKQYPERKVRGVVQVCEIQSDRQAFSAEEEQVWEIEKKGVSEAYSVEQKQTKSFSPLILAMSILSMLLISAFICYLLFR